MINTVDAQGVITDLVNLDADQRFITFPLDRALLPAQIFFGNIKSVISDVFVPF
jgi:hypothetical protein